MTIAAHGNIINSGNGNLLDLMFINKFVTYLYHQKQYAYLVDMHGVLEARITLTEKHCKDLSKEINKIVQPLCILPDFIPDAEVTAKLERLKLELTTHQHRLFDDLLEKHKIRKELDLLRTSYTSLLDQLRDSNAPPNDDLSPKRMRTPYPY